MPRFLRVPILAALASAALGLAAGPAGAQDSIRDIPEAGNAICDQIQGFVDEGKKQPDPFKTGSETFDKEFMAQACAGGGDESEDDETETGSDDGSSGDAGGGSAGGGGADVAASAAGGPAVQAAAEDDGSLPKTGASVLSPAAMALIGLGAALRRLRGAQKT